MAAKTFLKAILAISLFSLIMLLSTSAQVNTTTLAPNSYSIVKDKIEYYMQTDKAAYDVHENVQMLYRVTNVGKKDVEFIFTYGPIDNTCDWMVDKDEIRIWDNLVRPVTWYGTSFNLGPSQSYEYMYMWYMTDKNGVNISTGNYAVTGVLGYPSSHERYVPVSVSIDIIQEPGTHYVNPGESIQARIYDPNVVDGHTIIVYPGTYIENINFNGKNITLRSTDPNDPNVAAVTIIDGNQNGSVVTFNSGEDANCVLNGFTITNGNAEYGGGIYCVLPPDPPPIPPPPPPPGTLSEQSSPEVLSETNLTAPTIKNCIISNNSADRGGGMYNENGNPIIKNCTFRENFALRYGAGMYNGSFSSPTMTNCTFSTNSASSGGGMFNFNSTPTMTNCALDNNLADYQGGGAYNVFCISTLTGCTFNDNVSTDHGGGMYNDQSTLTLTNCNFFGNSAYDGGGLYNDQSTLTLTNCTFTDNSAIGIMNSRDYGTGGAIFNDHSSSNLTNCAFNENSAGDFGGGIYNTQSSPTMTNCTFSENSAFYEGGGMANFESSPTLTNCAFSENSARLGGGMYNRESSPIVANCTFITNSAISGAGIFNQFNNSLTLKNCTFTGNLAQYNGGGIYNTDGITTLDNCILWENRGKDGTDESAQIFGTSIIVDYSCIQGWTGALGGTGNIGADPCFVAPGYYLGPNCIGGYAYYGCTYDWIGGDYHLFPDSLCINAGDPNYIPGPNETDLDGNPRIIAGRIDMGGYEAPPPAEVRITPRTINLASKGNSITCYLWLPENYDVADIDPNGVLLQGKIEAESVQIDQGKQVVTARFSYEQLKGILDAGDVDLTISVRLTDATVFQGTDVIKVTYKGGGKFAKPVEASNPNPPDGATGVSRTADLSWKPSPSATSRDVYFGTGNPPPFIGNQTATAFDPGTMDYETTYYWRIDEINKWGTTTGQIWSFTTVPVPPPPPPPPPPP
ncbi:MAG: hypothetical protein FVQ85_14430 [Planctomycetes bacterium]|nr:hypothetical protein [Planctomycetota bacterium]